MIGDFLLSTIMEVRMEDKRKTEINVDGLGNNRRL